jgi:glycosyltransferase involved in cell wall biosynthesis
MVKKKLSFVLSERTPYHDILLHNLNKNCCSLNVYYLKQSSKKRPWEFNEADLNSYYCDTYKRFLNNFIKDIIREKPDLVIIGGHYEYKFILTLLSMKILNIPFALWGDVPRLDVERPWFTNLARSTILKWTYRNTRAVLNMGQPGLEACKIQGCPERKLHNLPYVVDLGVSGHPDQSTLAQADLLKKKWSLEGNFIFLCVGRLIPRKGYAVALRAFARISTQNPQQRKVILLAGDGPQRRELQELAQDLGISDRVLFLGWCQPEEVKALFSLSDVLVHTALWEPFGVVILEAMAWSLPVLATNKTMAAVDRIGHGENGFFHAVGDSLALADQMMYFLNDPEQIGIMGAKARQTAEKWPVSRCVQTILDLV